MSFGKGREEFGLRSGVSRINPLSDRKLTELAIKQRTLKSKMRIEQERPNLTMMEEQLKIQTEIDIKEAKLRVLDRAFSIGSVRGSRPRNQALEFTEDHLETVKIVKKLPSRYIIPVSPRKCDVRNRQMETLPGKSRNASLPSSPLLNHLPQMPKPSSIQGQEDCISIVKMMNKPNVTIEPFGRDSMQYHRFLHQFHSKVSNNCDDAEEKLELLGQFTKGDAHAQAVIREYLSMVNAEAT